MKPIGVMETPFPEKFGIPRQPLLVKEAWGKIRFPKDEFYSEAFRGIEGFTHLWITFEFNGIEENSVKAVIRPPRFHGKKKLGVFATRSPHRPNRLGLSVVEFDRMEVSASEMILHVRGVDIMNGSPVYDIKPYVPYVDSVSNARAELFEEAPKSCAVKWEVAAGLDAETKLLIEKIIGLDPRPGQDQGATDEYGVSLAGYNVRFKKVGDHFLITALDKRA